MAPKYTRPRGTQDVLPPDAWKWQYIEDVMKSAAHRCGYREIRLPTFESTDLFARGVGEGTDIVSKEMYTFTDKGGRSVTLRPEGTRQTAPCRTQGIASSFKVPLASGGDTAGVPVKGLPNLSGTRRSAASSGELPPSHRSTKLAPTPVTPRW